MTEFIDSHVHLADPAFATEVDGFVERARAAGARALVCIGESPAAALRASDIASQFPAYVFHTCGVHPHDAESWNHDRDSLAIRDAVRNGAVAIGECGLDYHYDFAPREEQLRALYAQLDLAAELARPLVLHTRDAEEDTLSFLKKAGQRGVAGVLHCFTGSTRLAQAGLDSNWFVSFSGIITFRSWSDERLLQMIPDDRLLVESDAPYLAPVPRRGKRNESAYVAYTVNHLASLREVSPQTIGQLSIDNAVKLFSLPSTLQSNN